MPFNLGNAFNTGIALSIPALFQAGAGFLQGEREDDRFQQQIGLSEQELAQQQEQFQANLDFLKEKFSTEKDLRVRELLAQLFVEQASIQQRAAEAAARLKGEGFRTAANAALQGSANQVNALQGFTQGVQAPLLRGF